ncbi:MAG: hypothetical protein LBS57_07180 [Treponema sp.]|nr:hypothetical protein [Treponema sp.]
MKSLFFALCLSAGALFPLSASDAPIGKIADDSSLRISVKDSWLTETPERALAKRPVIHRLPGGGKVELRAEAGGDEFMVILARELTGGAGGAGTAAGFPGWAQGSWILTRRRDTGAAARIRVFLRSDPYVYVQFRPLYEDKCRMDVVLYDAYIVRSLPLPVPFERLYTMPVEDALKLAGDKFPRRYFDVDPADYRDERLLISRIRKFLPGLNFADDGAIDENGNYVYINTLAPQSAPGIPQGTPPQRDAWRPPREPAEAAPGLNCSGFVKWLVDGILRPFTGKRLSIGPLKAPFGERGSSFTDPWEERRDPFFGLDWNRNLASRAALTLRSPAYAAPEEIEVRAEPFSQLVIRGKNTVSIRNYPGFLENAGYGIEGLKPLLYTLSVDDPGKIYLAAVNNETGPASTPDNPRGAPRLRQYFHVAVLIPYFNEYGGFRIAVFESAAETSFNAFQSRYPAHYVNLVRVPLETRFDP